LPSPLLRARRIDAPYEPLPLQDVCHALRGAKEGAIAANERSRETTLTTKLESFEQKRLMRASHTRAHDGDYRANRSNTSWQTSCCSE